MRFTIDDIPEIKEGECILAEIEYAPGVAIIKREYYLLDKRNVGTEKKPAIRVFNPKISEQYLEPETIEVDEILGFNPVDASQDRS